MAIEFFLDCKLCPINQKYFVVNGRNILSTKYRQNKAYLTDLFSQHDKQDRPEKPYKITVHSHQYSDIDSGVKIVMDSLEAAGVIENDRYVECLHVIKAPTKRGSDQEHYIRIEHYEAEQG